MEEQSVTQAREVVFSLETCYPEERYTRAMFIPTIRKPLKFCKYAMLPVLAELLALSVLNQKWCGSMLLVTAVYLWILFGIPLHAKKKYRKLHAAGEDRISYVFYDDSVQIKSPTAELLLEYNTAESNMENETYLMINFRLGRKVVVRKEDCTAEQLAFLRNIVPPETQQKREKSAAFTGRICIAVLLFYALLLGCNIVSAYRHRADAGQKQTAHSTFESFEQCLNDGMAKDIRVEKERRIEYTFSDHHGHEARYYTYYDGDLRLLPDLIADPYCPDCPKTTFESFEACLKGGLVKDMTVIKDRFIEYTFTGHAEDERLYTVFEGDRETLDALLANSYGSHYKSTTYDSFVSCLSSGRVRDVEIINDRFVEYTYVSPDTGVGERLFTVCEEDINTLNALLDFYGVSRRDSTAE